MSLPAQGTTLHARYADDGEFYPAEVVQVSQSKKRAGAPVKVHFKGWDDDDVWVSLNDLKSKAYGLYGGAPTDKTQGKASKTDKKKPKPTHKDVPSVCEEVRAPDASGKLWPAQVVGAKLQVQFKDGTTKWIPVDDIKRKPHKNFACTDCGQAFQTENGRDNHWWEKHVVSCTECGKMFDDEEQRDEHWWEAHVVYCKQCGKVCSSMEALVQHAYDAHQYVQNLINVGQKKVRPVTSVGQTMAGSR